MDRPSVTRYLVPALLLALCVAASAQEVDVAPDAAAAAAALQPAADPAATEALIAAQAIPQPEPVPQATEDPAAATTDPTAAPLVPVTPDRLFAKTLVANRFDRAFRLNSLGFGFSGSGFLMIYHWGVHAVMQAAGIYTPSTRFAGSSGGSIAAAMGCSSATQLQFGSVAAGAAVFCRGLATNQNPFANCRTILDSVAFVGLSVALPTSAHALCNGRLHVSVTHARRNPATDIEVKVSTFPTREVLIESLLASSYVPGFSGNSNQKLMQVTIAPNVRLAYDGVGANPLPVPPALTTANVAVSAIVPTPNPTSPISFGRLLQQANANPSILDTTVYAGYQPLDPQASTTGAATSADIYPGISGPNNRLPTATTAALSLQWNEYILEAPRTPAEIIAIYNQGRNDAAWFIRQNFVDNPGRLATVAPALTATALTPALLNQMQPPQI